MSTLFFMKLNKLTLKFLWNTEELKIATPRKREKKGKGRVEWEETLTARFNSY